MNNKTIFAIAAIILFALAGVAGYAGPDWLRDYRAARDQKSFTSADMPKDVEKAFSKHFNGMFKESSAKRLPDVSVLDMQGIPARITDFAGKPTLVNMWATWCAPCVVELPSLKKLSDHYGDRLNVIGIAIEVDKSPAQIVAFLEKRGLEGFAAYLDKSGDFAQKLGLQGLPTSFLIGSDGLILYRFVGDAVWTSPESKDFFDAFLLQNK